MRGTRPVSMSWARDSPVQLRWRRTAKADGERWFTDIVFGVQVQDSGLAGLIEGFIRFLFWSGTFGGDLSGDTTTSVIAGSVVVEVELGFGILFGEAALPREERAVVVEG